MNHDASSAPNRGATPLPAVLRILIRCPRCLRQYDAGALRAGDRFRCACGELVAVPTATPREAEIVRCSSCGAPRRTGETRCPFCGADYALGEVDRNTLCPACGARVADRARFCSNCGVPIVPEALAGERTELACPACGAGSTLVSRRLPDSPTAVLECPLCSGLWLGSELFDRLVERARQGDVALLHHAAPEPAQLAPGNMPLYRHCPVCGKLMNRRNYGEKSGVIVDVCGPHGLWFDADELTRIREWIRRGGLREAVAVSDEERNSRGRKPEPGGGAALPDFEPLPGNEDDPWRAFVNFCAFLWRLFRAR